MAEIAAVSGVPAETLRKIETGRIATPAFFTVAALAAALGLSLEEIALACSEPRRGAQRLTRHRDCSPYSALYGCNISRKADASRRGAGANLTYPGFYGEIR